jgi:hypothetical protein
MARGKTISVAEFEAICTWTRSRGCTSAGSRRSSPLRLPASTASPFNPIALF